MLLNQQHFVFIDFIITIILINFLNNELIKIYMM